MLNFATAMGIQAQRQKLAAGDYVWILMRHGSHDEEHMLPVCVERKSWDDLNYSLGQGRMQRQMDNMTARGFHHKFLLIEGSSQDMVSKPTQQRRQHIKDTLERFELEKGFHVVFSPSWYKSANWLLQLTYIIGQSGDMGTLGRNRAGIDTYLLRSPVTHTWSAEEFTDVIFGMDPTAQEEVFERCKQRLGNVKADERHLLLLQGVEEYNKTRQKYLNQALATFLNSGPGTGVKDVIDRELGAVLHQMVHYDVHSYWITVLQVFLGVHVMRSEDPEDTTRLTDVFTRAKQDQQSLDNMFTRKRQHEDVMTKTHEDVIEGQENATAVEQDEDWALKEAIRLSLQDARAALHKPEPSPNTSLNVEQAVYSTTSKKPDAPKTPETSLAKQMSHPKQRRPQKENVSSDLGMNQSEVEYVRSVWSRKDAEANTSRSCRDTPKESAIMDVDLTVSCNARQSTDVGPWSIVEPRSIRHEPQRSTGMDIIDIEPTRKRRKTNDMLNNNSLSDEALARMLQQEEMNKSRDKTDLNCLAEIIPESIAHGDEILTDEAYARKLQQEDMGECDTDCFLTEVIPTRTQEKDEELAKKLQKEVDKSHDNSDPSYFFSEFISSGKDQEKKDEELAKRLQEETDNDKWETESERKDEELARKLQDGEKLDKGTDMLARSFHDDDVEARLREEREKADEELARKLQDQEEPLKDVDVFARSLEEGDFDTKLKEEREKADEELARRLQEEEGSVIKTDNDVKMLKPSEIKQETDAKGVIKIENDIEQERKSGIKRELQIEDIKQEDHVLSDELYAKKLQQEYNEISQQESNPSLKQKGKEISSPTQLVVSQDEDSEDYLPDIPQGRLQLPKSNVAHVKPMVNTAVASTSKMSNSKRQELESKRQVRVINVNSSHYKCVYALL